MTKKASKSGLHHSLGDEHAVLQKGLTGDLKLTKLKVAWRCLLARFTFKRKLPLPKNFIQGGKSKFTLRLIAFGSQVIRKIAR